MGKGNKYFSLKLKDLYYTKGFLPGVDKNKYSHSIFKNNLGHKISIIFKKYHPQLRQREKVEF